MDMNAKRKVVVGIAAGLLLVGAGGAFAAGKLTSPKEERQAVINDAAKRLNVRPSRDLWHGLLFFNSGTIVTQVLAAAGDLGLLDCGPAGRTGFSASAIHGVARQESSFQPEHGAIARVEARAFRSDGLG